ncbi:MAG: response regulator transcription factor [Pelolinea sp.]|nr:response regulator transcription factor [Pelolinea sp.]
MAKILIIEDELELVKVLRSYLENAGFSVVSALRGDTGLAAWQNEAPDLVLLDLSLPGLDGIEVTKAIRKTAATPIIIITARVEDTDRIVGLELGADDYVTKPFSPREVVARVKAVLRRAQPVEELTKKIIIKDLEIDAESYKVKKAGEPLELTRMEFAILQTMAEHPGKVFSRLQLLEAAQGVAYEGYERTIDAHIKNLRSKLGDKADRPNYIETSFGIGYSFKED